MMWLRCVPSAATSLRTWHKLKLPWLGITGNDAQPDSDDGLPAGGGGLQAGDIVIALGPAQVTSITALVLAARAYKVGDTVPVTLRRKDQTFTFHLTLGSLP
jgi:S1-C subfamily serine protease